MTIHMSIYIQNADNTKKKLSSYTYNNELEIYCYKPVKCFI